MNNKSKKDKNKGLPDEEFAKLLSSIKKSSSPSLKKISAFSKRAYKLPSETTKSSIAYFAKTISRVTNENALALLYAADALISRFFQKRDSSLFNSSGEYRRDTSEDKRHTIGSRWVKGIEQSLEHLMGTLKYSGSQEKKQLVKVLVKWRDFGAFKIGAVVKFTNLASVNLPEQTSRQEKPKSNAAVIGDESLKNLSPDKVVELQRMISNEAAKRNLHMLPDGSLVQKREDKPEPPKLDPPKPDPLEAKKRKLEEIERKQQLRAKKAIPTNVYGRATDKERNLGERRNMGLPRDTGDSVFNRPVEQTKSISQKPRSTQYNQGWASGGNQSQGWSGAGGAGGYTGNWDSWKGGSSGTNNQSTEGSSNKWANSGWNSYDNH
eukprot:augustus_masked-scaffold_1-processed-gene-8.57-mRNA-1 protein AED:1.00 eAED:1.00 QI:0/-1/0/0/-1/1/1/0/378